MPDNLLRRCAPALYRFLVLEIGIFVVGECIVVIFLMASSPLNSLKIEKSRLTQSNPVRRLNSPSIQ